MRLTAREIASAAGGEVVAGSVDAQVTSFSIDSRTIAPGACFVALEAERDGHAFVADAVARGATAALVRADVEVGPTGSPAIIRVRQPLHALTEVARAVRARMSDVTVVGVTGSAGKTATKDLTAAAVAPAATVHASPASFNNEAGLPLTLLGAPDDVQVIVAEMGARFAGNIRDLATIARPRIGVVTHIGWAHAEHLEGREGIAAVKGELLEALPSDGLAVLNAGCDATPSLARRTEAPVLTVGRTRDADVVIGGIDLDDDLRPKFSLETPWGSLAVALDLRGEHQVENAAMAAVVALHLGVDPESVAVGLASARGAVQRMELLRTPDGVAIVNDAYNSSPTSAVAAVRSLARLAVEGRRIAVLGEMRELGAHADEGYAALGAAVVAAELDVLVAVGPMLQPLLDAVGPADLEIHHVADADGAVALLLREARSGDAVLVKASRAVGLEQVAEALAEREPAS